MGHKILLADDSITIQKVIELTFSDEDFELHTVGNGQKAIDEIHAIQPDIVLCDIIMPEKNGYEVCEFIKSNDELNHIPVLLLTGAFEPFDQERAKAVGCDGFLAKPFEPQTLISKVKELLAGAHGAPAGAQAPAPATAMPAPEPLMPDTMQDVGPMAGDGNETVLVPPTATGATPPAVGGPRVPAMPTVAPADSSALGDAFAVEAGERELAMDSGDHTVLLGANDSPDVPAPRATPPGASDDIWSDAGSALQPEPPAEPLQAPQPPQAVPPTPEPDQDGGATVFMAQPPDMSVPPGEASLGGPVDNEMSVGHEDPEATWQMPPSTPQTPGASLPPAENLGGFEDFAAAPPAGGEPTPMVESPEMDKMNMAPPPPPPPPTMQDEPPSIDAAPDPGIDPFAPDPPELMSTDDGSPVEITPDSIPSVDTRATMDPVMAGADAFAPLPSTPEPANPEPPRIAEMPVMPMEPETSFTPVKPANELETLDEPAPPTFHSPPEPPIVSTPSEPEPDLVPEAPPVMDVMPATPVTPVTPVTDAAVESPPSTTEAQVPGTDPDEDLIERIAQRVVDKLSSKIIEEIAWEVVPDLAEGLIRREIDVLKSKIPKSG